MLKKLAGQTATYGLSSVLARLLGNLLLPLQTGRLSLHDFSVLSEALAWGALLSVLFPLGLETALFRFSNDNPERKELTENNIISFQIFCAGLLLPASLTFLYWRMPLLDSSMLLVLGFTLVLDSVQGIFLASLRNRQMPLSFLKVRLASVGLSILLNLFFLSGWEMADAMNPVGVNFKLILWINFACSALSFLPMLSRIRLFEWKLNKELNRKVLLFSVPIVGMGLVGIGNEILGRIWLENLCPSGFYPGIENKDLIGIYSGAAKIAVFINLGIQAYRYAADPFFFSFQERKDTAHYMAASFTWFAAAGLLALVAIQVNLDFILQLFLRRAEFSYAKDAIFLLLLANLFFGAYYNLSFWYKFSGKTWWGTLISVSGLLLNGFFNFLLVPRMGMTGAALALLICAAVMSLASWFRGRTEFPVDWEYAKLGVLLFAALFLCLLPVLLPEFPARDWIIGILMPVFYAGLILFVQKKQLKRHAV
jgi:O-antigen/teichoic acid export membrane protein